MSTAMVVRGEKGKWAAGSSGNPSGYPAALTEVRNLARQHTERAIQRLAEWIESDNAKASVAACAILLDRGWGKSPVAVHLDARGELVTAGGALNLQALTPDEFATFRALVLKAKTEVKP